MTAHLEDIIDQTGGCGLYQIILCLIVHCCKLLLCFALLFMVFGGMTPDWWCGDDLIGDNSSAVLLIGQNISSTDLIGRTRELTTGIRIYKSCTTINGSACRSFIFDESPRTIVSEWSLVCDDTWISTTITSVQMAGIFVGNVAGGQLADLIGRKPPFYIAIGLMTGLSFVTIFSNSWTMFAVLRFFIGVALGFQLTVMYSIQSEFVLTKWRTWVVAIPSWHMAIPLFAMTAWLFQDWKYIHVTGAVIGVVSFATCWFTLGLGTYGIQFGLQALSGSVYVNLCVVAAMNIPLQFLLIYLQNRFGRKPTIILHFAVFAVAALISGIFSRLEATSTNLMVSRIAALIANLVINALWSPIQTHTLELYPTVIRNLGYGLQNTLARAGAVIGPQLVFLDTKFSGIMYFVCTVIGILSIIVILPLPETKGKDLSDKLP